MNRAHRSGRHKAPKTALVRRSAPQRRPGPRRAPAGSFPPAGLPERTLGADPLVGTLGLKPMNLTPAQEAILAEAVPVEAVRIKPTGQVYLSHPDYTRWFNRAFGRLGWALVPVAKPIPAAGVVLCSYILHVKGQPVAFAIGEQEYFESNKDQTYGDAIEATNASALRRIAKRLGVGLELWDKPWIEAFIAAHALRVPCRVERDGRAKVVYQWRLIKDAPFWNEVRTTDHEHDQRRPERTERKPAGSHAAEDEPINAAQLERFWMTLRKSGRDEEIVRGWLLKKYHLISSKTIPRRVYNEICEAIEAPGDLPS